MLTEAEILAVLHAIETGAVQLIPDGDIPPDANWGDVPYTTSTGWKIRAPQYNLNYCRFSVRRSPKRFVYLPSQEVYDAHTNYYSHRSR